MNIETTAKYHFISTPFAIKKKKRKNSSWQGCGAVGTLGYFWWGFKMV